jgi:hypothetical protein
MIKFMVAALWISIATTGALVFTFKSALENDAVDHDAAPTAFAGLDFVRTGIISVPVFEKGKVHGYFLARLVYTAEAQRLAQLKLPAEAILTDIVYSQLYANPEIDFTSREKFDVDSFREMLRVGMNEKIGEDLIREILVEQIDYLPKDVVGTSQTRPREPATAVH